jgi:hypothetical protein
MTAYADSYTIASGGTLSAGMNPPSPGSPPNWRPAAGQFKDISLNTLRGAAPAGWPSSDVAGPFLNWAGGFFNPYWGTYGGVVVRGSGHLTHGTPVWGGNWIWDVGTRLWVGANVPGAPLLEDTSLYNGFFESTQAASLGHTYVPHTYDGLVLRSPANGGSAKGSMWATFSPGSTGYPNFIHEYDLSSASAPPVRKFDDVPLGGSNSSYPMAALDEARGGYWLLPANGAAPLKFIHFDATVTSYAGIGYGCYGDNSLIYLPAPFDCLVGMGRNNADNTTFCVFVCPIIGGVPQGFVEVTPTGTQPNDGRCGGVWVADTEWTDGVGKIVCYEAGRSYRVHMLTPPASGSLTTGTWAWTYETLVGDQGQLPSNPGVNVNNGLPYTENGIWSRFVHCPAAKCFLFCNGVNAPMQAWRLTGLK